MRQLCLLQSFAVPLKQSACLSVNLVLHNTLLYPRRRLVLSPQSPQHTTYFAQCDIVLHTFYEQRHQVLRTASDHFHLIKQLVDAFAVPTGA